MAPKDPASPRLGRWLRRRSLLVPTWRGWLAIFLLLSFLAYLTIRSVHPFLAIRDPSSGGVLVVEGWSPDFAIKAALEELNSGKYGFCIVTGGPLEKGAPLSRFGSYAELGAATLIAFGAPSNSVTAVPAPGVQRDRTYHSAVALRRHLEAHHIQGPIHVLTVGAHARRSRFLFQKAFGKTKPITVFGIPEVEYDSRHWWKNSAGVRSVVGEALAYFYVRCFFQAEETP